jgi:hypothetical protein
MKLSKREKEKLLAGDILTYAIWSSETVKENGIELKEVLIQPAHRLWSLISRLEICCNELKSYGYMPSVLREIFILEKFKALDLRGTRSEVEMKIGCAALLRNLKISTLKDMTDTLNNALNIKINERKSLMDLKFACMVILLSHHIFYNDEGWMKIFNRTEYYLTSKSHEAIGYWTAKLERMKDSKESQGTKKEQREIKERLVIETYLKMVNDKTEKAVLKTLSENKMAQRVKERAEPELTKVKTSDGKPVLKRTIDHKGNIKYTGLSTKTIIDILRKRDKTKILFYPWENRDASRT